MNRVAFVASIVFFAAYSSASWADAPAWGSLNDWVGHYPTDKSVKGPGKGWALGPVAVALRKHLAPADLRRLTRTYAVETPVEAIEGFVVARVCMPHACPQSHALAVFDTRAPRVWFAFFERRNETVSTRWFGTDVSAALPVSVLATFDNGHIAR